VRGYAGGDRRPGPDTSAGWGGASTPPAHVRPDRPGGGATDVLGTETLLGAWSRVWTTDSGAVSHSHHSCPCPGSRPPGSQPWCASSAPSGQRDGDSCGSARHMQCECPRANASATSNTIGLSVVYLARLLLATTRLSVNMFRTQGQTTSSRQRRGLESCPGELADSRASLGKPRNLVQSPWTLLEHPAHPSSTGTKPTTAEWSSSPAGRCRCTTPPAFFRSTWRFASSGGCLM